MKQEQAKAELFEYNQNFFEMINKFSNYFFVLIFCATSIVAQDFTINIHNQVLSDTLGSEMIFAIDLVNNSQSELNVSIVRRNNNMPDSWSSSLCFDNCFAPHLDSISTSASFGSSPIAAGETAEMSLHVFPYVNLGYGHFTLDLLNENNPQEIYQVEFVATADVVSVTENNLNDVSYKLAQNYPNPFNPSTKIKYSISNSGGLSEHVSLKIYDTLGREMATLVNQFQNAGTYEVTFDANKLSSGIYFYELKTANFHQIKKMILEK